MKKQLSQVLLMAVLPWQFGCSATVSCPPVQNGQLVVLLDHGRHASLLVEAESDRMIRYSYGDWSYYALARQQVWSGIRALLWPTRAGLGRKVLTGDIQAFQDYIAVEIEESYVLTVDEARLRKLRERLERIYQTNKQTLHYNPAYDLQFVHHPESYFLLNNSNTKTAEWLDSLGCQVSGITQISNWRIVRPAGTSGPGR